MIQSFEIKDFGPIKEVGLKNAGKINLVIGSNGSGKTMLLKALYSAIKTTELYGRGKDTHKDSEILFEKLHWTFQVDQLGKIVRSGSKNLEFSVEKEKRQKFSFAFGPSTERQVKIKENSCTPTTVNSIFLPAKEVLSLVDVILKSREIDADFGFDDTYYDLAKSLRIKPTKGRNYPQFSESRTQLEERLGGTLVYVEQSKEWFFKKGNKLYPVSITSEGIKKMSILDTLLGNHYIKKDSVIFIDEPEAALHPSLITTFMDIIQLLTHAGLQFFISSHSYFVIKKLYLLAHQNEMNIPVISFVKEGEVEYGNLKNEMPDNAIIDESIRLYREEIDL